MISKSWSGLPKTSEKFWKKETFLMDADDRLVSVTLDQETSPFATWLYMGTLPVRRLVKESGIISDTDYNEFLEPVTLSIRNKFTDPKLGQLQYGYGPQGQSEFASSKLNSEKTNRLYEFAAYSSFDSFRRLVAQNAEQKIPDVDHWQERAEQMLGDPSDKLLSAIQTQRMKYDQANNIWVTYTGGYLKAVKAKDFSRLNNPIFTSPANPMTLNRGQVQDMDLKALASNRDVSLASYSDSSDTLTVKTQVYDKLGCLTEFDGTYWNGVIRRPAKWNLTYDALGRLVIMKASASEDSLFDNVKGYVTTNS